MADENTNEGGGENTGENTGEGTPQTLADFIKTDQKHQDELNKMMAANRRKTTEENQKLVQELEQLKRNQHLTVEERDTLQARITQLEEQFLTKEELAKREATKQQREFESKYTEATQEKDFWKNLYAGETVDRALQDAAVNHEAEKPWQVVDMLRQRTQLIEELDEGKPTGRYVPIVKFNDINEEGQEVTLDLSPDSALKRMKELPDKYGNLFKGMATGGLGENNTSGSSVKTSLNEIMNDPVKYAKWRKENPDLDMSKLKR